MASTGTSLRMSDAERLLARPLAVGRVTFRSGKYLPGAYAHGAVYFVAAELPSCLHILDINPFSDLPSANVSCRAGCLFCVPAAAAVQKLLGLMRSHWLLSLGPPPWMAFVKGPGSVCRHRQPGVSDVCGGSQTC